MLVKPTTLRTWILAAAAAIALTLLFGGLAIKAAKYINIHVPAKRDILLIAVFMLVITVPMVTSDTFDQEAEQRTETEFPAAVTTAFPSEFEAWYGDHFGLRSTMMELYATLDYLVFDQLILDRVTIGKEHWLFYTPQGNINTIKDFQGTNLLTEEQLAAMAERQLDIYNTLQAKGIQYMLFIPPNKGTIYPELIPDGILKVSETTRMDQVIEYLRQYTDIPIVDVRDALLNAKSEATLYYASDTHWNKYGAFIAYQQLMTAIAQCEAMSDYQSALAPDSLSDYMISKYIREFGDLIDIAQLSPELYKGESIGYTFEPLADQRYTKQEGEGKDFTTIIDDHSLPAALVYRDSFFTAVYAFFANHFSCANYIWADPKLDTIIEDTETTDVDLVIVEIVERFILNY